MLSNEEVLDISKLWLFVALSDRMATTLRDLAVRINDPEALLLVEEYRSFKKSKPVIKLETCRSLFGPDDSKDT